MRKSFLLIMGILCTVASLHAQSPPEIKPLTIGDTVPDIKFNDLLNYKSHTARLSDFRSKLLILDFFATTCSGCISDLPRYDSLQQHFAKKIQIIPVTTENNSKVDRFLGQNKIGKMLRHLSFVTNDTVLSMLFPHQFLPHEVWIGSDGIVKAVTTWQYINSKNIKAVLQGTVFNWPVKNDIRDYAYSQPILLPNNHNIHGTTSNYYSVVSSYIENAFPQSETDTINTGRPYMKTSIVNMPIINMYLWAFKKAVFPRSHIILDVKNKSRFIYNSDSTYRDVWDKNNRFCYEGKFPLGLSPDSITDKVTSDLDFYFGIKGRIEKKMVDCFALIKLKNKVFTKRLKPDNRAHKISIANLIWYLNDIHWGQPVLDETGLNPNTKFLLKNISDISVLNKELANYGLELMPVKAKFEMLIIREDRITNGLNFSRLSP